MKKTFNFLGWAIAGSLKIYLAFFLFISMVIGGIVSLFYLWEYNGIKWFIGWLMCLFIYGGIKGWRSPIK